MKEIIFKVFEGMKYKNYKPGDIIEINNINYILISYNFQFDYFYGLVNMQSGKVIFKQEELSFLNTIIYNLKNGILKC